MEWDSVAAAIEKERKKIHSDSLLPLHRHNDISHPPYPPVSHETIPDHQHQAKVASVEAKVERRMLPFSYPVDERNLLELRERRGGLRERYDGAFYASLIRRY